MTAWVLDLDGVVWLGERAIPGSAEAVATLRSAGHEVTFCTNNSSATRTEYEARLAGHGIEAAGSVLSSAGAVARLVVAGERVSCVAGPGVREAVEDVGAEVVPADAPRIDAVVLGFHREFDYAAMRSAVRAVLGGARLLATNDDPIFPDADGPAPGCGAIVASVERACGRRAAIAGKPHGPMAALVRERHGADGVVVGDSPVTDGGLATRLGWTFGLVLSGNTASAAAASGVSGGASGPEWVAPDLRTLVERHA